jgi:hypothetical protein
MTAMTPVPTVAEHVHRDKSYEDQNPKPVCHNPLHDFCPSGLWLRDLVDA